MNGHLIIFALGFVKRNVQASETTITKMLPNVLVIRSSSCCHVASGVKD
jgi:hypothetical protein